MKREKAAEQIESASKDVEGVEKIWETVKPHLGSLTSYLPDPSSIV